MGLNFFAWTTLVGGVVAVLVLGAELGGVALSVQLLTGVNFRWWVLPAAFGAWLVLWRGRFGVIERVVGFLGLVTLSFAYGAIATAPPVADVLRGIVPSLPHHNAATYWFIAVSIIGALVSPYLFYFYSSGALEDRWTERDLRMNRVVATAGMGFGSVAAFGVLVAAAMVLRPRGIHVTHYEDAALLLSIPLGRTGLLLFAASLGIACFGAAVEIALTIGYVLAQGLGWEWGEDRRPRDAPRFALAYTLTLAVAVVPTLAGPDPLELTVFTMALTALTLPIDILPFLAIMNDREYMRGHVNGALGNAIVLVVVAVSCVLAVVTIPLELLGG